ncbi:GTPase Era [Candidatus Bipolaricaulota bacterium]|nr:GTPase Era [Candidatus Bipolaricaulota bacterium]TFH09832.1 MAG: GTPase Era [Candidatus Atribacteria bacterium]
MTALREHSDENSKKMKTGFVAVLGQTNVGKSTFLNAAIGRKLLITSNKPQTTRNRIRCVLTTDKAQIVFVDTPGLHKPGDQLSRHILREARRALRGMDLLVYVVEPWGAIPELDRKIFDEWNDIDVPIILLVNKIDQAKGNAVEETLIAYEKTGLFAELIPISAMRWQGIHDVIDTISEYLSPGLLLFSPEETSDQTEDFLIAELIREKIFRLTHKEIPYSTAVRLKWLNERDDGIIEIKAEIIVERDSQKGILIGKGGKMIKKIGSLARTDIESLLGSRVFLETIVKVKANWTNDADQIEQLTHSTR